MAKLGLFQTEAQNCHIWGRVWPHARTWRNSPRHPLGWFIPQICFSKWLRRWEQYQETIMLVWTFAHWENVQTLGGKKIKIKKNKDPRWLAFGNYMTKPWTDEQNVFFHTRQINASPCKASVKLLVKHDKHKSAHKKSKKQKNLLTDAKFYIQKWWKVSAILGPNNFWSTIKGITICMWK